MDTQKVTIAQAVQYAYEQADKVHTTLSNEILQPCGHRCALLDDLPYAIDALTRVYGLVTTECIAELRAQVQTDNALFARLAQHDILDAGVN